MSTTTETNANQDLTRWNRAGLSRVRYVDGNAVTYLEVVRDALARRLPQWEELTDGVPEDPESEPAADRRDRLAAQYEAERRDALWEIGRALARAAHVLTEHVDAYANEGFLGTATQWENVRRLVGMLDHHPAPPSSASTFLVLEAKDAGVVEKGFQVRHTPPDGGAPVVFETLDDVPVDPVLNALYLQGHDRSPALLSGSTLTLEGRIEGLSLGRPVVLEDTSDEGAGALQARLVAGVEVGETSTLLTVSEPFADLPEGHVLVHLDPADVLEPHGPTPGEVQVEDHLWLRDEAKVLAAGDVVYLSDATRGYYRLLVKAEGRRIDWDPAKPLGALDLDDAYVSRARALPVAGEGGSDVTVEGDFSSLVGIQVVALPATELIELTVVGASYLDGLTVLSLSASSQGSAVIYVPPVGRELEADTFLRASDAGAPVADLETAAPGKTSAGDVAVVLRKDRLAWGRLANVGADPETGRAVLSVAQGWQDTWTPSGSEPFYLAETRVYGHFRRAVRLVGRQENDTPVSGSDFTLEAAVPASLFKGRTVLLEQAGGGAVHQAVVVSKDTELSTVTLSPAVELGEGFTVGNTVVRANLALAGHGESRREKILGSGDATVSRPSFVLRQAGVSHVADATRPGGVRTELTVRVEGRAWRQVSTLRDSRPSDRHYTARQTEEGYVEIAFGDGRNGQRLPTGADNVRATCRVGSGLAGNLAPGSLAKAARPHPLVESARQPLAATGGNDREDAASLRDKAPAGVLTLERAVSLDDFARLAESHRGLWQANAFAMAPDLPRPDRRRVEVVAVPAGGGDLGNLAETVRQFLAAHTLPGVEVVVSSYETVPLAIEVTVRVRSAESDPEQVAGDVRTALLETFSLRRGKLGQDLYLSDVYAVVEQVPGVESSHCLLNGDAALRRLPASPRDVIHLDPETDPITIDPQEYEL